MATSGSDSMDLTQRDKPAVFKVGAAQLEITPPLGTHLAGFFHVRVAESVHDPLYCRAMVIESGDSRLALVSLDTICVDAGFVDPAKAKIHEACGISPERVLVCATHTHTGPEVRLVGNKVERNEAWLAKLPDLVFQAVRDACDRTKPATLQVGQTSAEGYPFNRLYRRRDGLEQMGRGSDPSGLLGPAGPVDSMLEVLKAVDEQGEVIAMMVNLGLHPVTIAGGDANFFSAEWPGVMCDALRSVYGPQCVAMFMQGACGDINHQPYDSTNLPTHGPAKTTQLGRGLAGAALLAAERAEPLTDPTVEALVEHIDVPYYTRTPEIFEEVKALKALEKRDAAQAYFIKAVEEWTFDNQICKVPLQAMRIGDLAMANIPAQVFTPIGTGIKQWSPARQTMVVELANTRVTSYIPTADQVERGAYGSRPVVSRWLSPDAGRRFIDAYLVMFQKLWA